jgi:hypothetical protein
MKNVVILYNMATFTKQHIGIALFAIAVIVVGVFKPKLLEFNARDSLSNGEGLEPGEGLVNGPYRLNYELDGTLNISELTKKGELKIIDKLSNKRINKSQLTFIDGDLAISTETTDGEEKIRWRTKTEAKGASVLKLRDDGILAIIDKQGKTIWVSSGRIREGFNRFNGTDTNFTEYENDKNGKALRKLGENQDALKQKLNELNHLGNPSLNISKTNMDTTIYISILWTAIATALIYYIATNI